MSSKADIWMPLYIGDILADTSHLDAERFGCYMLWLMHYWRKGPLTADLVDLIAIGKLRGRDAPSIAQRLLAEFFMENVDGRWHQKRADIEIAKWQDKSLTAKEKARKAAETRWGKKDAPSIDGALLEPCPLPSPSPLPSTTPLPASPPPTKQQKQKPLSKGKPSTAKDARSNLFRQDFEEHFLRVNGVDAPWHAKEATTLLLWLQANPTIGRAQWEHILHNRAASPINQTAPLSRWISIALSWLNGPADEWGKPITGGPNGHVKRNGAQQREAANFAFLQPDISNQQTDPGASQGSNSAAPDGQGPGAKRIDLSGVGRAIEPVRS